MRLSPYIWGLRPAIVSGCRGSNGDGGCLDCVARWLCGCEVKGSRGNPARFYQSEVPTMSSCQTQTRNPEFGLEATSWTPGRRDGSTSVLGHQLFRPLTPPAPHWLAAARGSTGALQRCESPCEKATFQLLLRGAARADTHSLTHSALLVLPHVSREHRKNLIEPPIPMFRANAHTNAFIHSSGWLWEGAAI